jgi:4-diphosphocytidyl-2-C-methyl-D-erythritol kinase
MKVVKEKAYAKINLYLDVLAKREDGFHDIKTVMHSISLCDNVTVSQIDSRTINVKMGVFGCHFLPVDERNLCVRAARLFLERAGINASVHIYLEKNIPVSAGLAGGSTDAAAVLRALNRLNGRIFTDKMLMSLAADLGSDVPYCILGKTALCEGRGEIITRLRDLQGLHVVIAIANERVSTQVAYKALDEAYSDFVSSNTTGGEQKFGRLISAINNDEFYGDGVFNAFEYVILPMCNGASMIKSFLEKQAPLATLMSGSGPSVYAIFNSEHSARQSVELLKAQGITAFYAVSV